MADLDNGNNAEGRNVGGIVDWMKAGGLSDGWRGTGTAGRRTKKPHSNCFK